MSSEQHRRAKEVFLAACDLLGEGRDAFIASTCGDDSALLDEVRSLLRFHDDGAAGELPGPAGISHQIGDLVGPYRLLATLGEGGMGVVYEAEQQEPVRRRVALKLVKWGMDTREVLARFDGERQALALMDHPAIAHVLEAGATEQGRPFFAMELVTGEPITSYCDRRQLTVAQRLRLLVQVCHGVQHAHQKGIIHRDLKPSNVLVTEQDEQPVPKIIDFGVAKAMGTGSAAVADLTRLGQWIGTPEYMSPEQAGLGETDVDTRSDVYSLGVILHELLVGSVPFAVDSAGPVALDEVRRRIRDEAPRRPSTAARTRGDGSWEAAKARGTDPSGLARTLRGDLDWITMKALDKERSRRYGSAAELAADIERHLHNEPVTARPPNAAYRIGKLVRRNRVAVTAAAVVVVALVAGTVAATIGLMRAEQEAAAAQQASEMLIGIFQEMDPSMPFGYSKSVRELLDLGAERVGGALAQRPVQKARIVGTIGQVYFSLGQYDQARRLLEQALSLQREHLRASDPSLIATLAALGWVHSLTADYRAARRYAEEAVALAEAAYGPGHRITLGCRDNLAWLLWKTGSYAEARAMLDDALALGEQSLAPDDPRIADLLFNRALLLRETGEFQDAYQSLERCLRIREKAFGGDHTAVGWALNDLGLSLRGIGQLEQARRTFERAVAIQERALGPNHMAVAYPLCNLGILDLASGDLDMARQRLERSLAIREHALGPENPDLAWDLNSLAILARRRGDVGSSLALLRRSLAIQEKALGPGHPEAIRTLLVLAVTTQYAGQAEEARLLGDRAEQVLLAPAAARNRRTAVDLYNLACLRAVQGSSEKALELLRQAVDDGFVSPVLRNDPDLDSLRGDARFAAIVAEVEQRLAVTPS